MNVFQTQADLRAEIEEERTLIVDAWIHKFKSDPQMLTSFLEWCEDQGHLAEYHKLYIDPLADIEDSPEDGIYLLRDDVGYEKTVEAMFKNGKLTRLVDKDGNDWMGWQRHVRWDEPRDAHQ